MQLGEITEPKIDQAGPPANGEFTYVDISSVDNNAKRIVEPKRLPADSAPSRARQRLRSGDVLVSMTRPNLNAVALVPPELDGAIGSTGFHVLRARDGVLPQWLYYGVQTRQFVGAMSELVQGALYPAVRPKDIRAFDMPLPALDEQRRIVAEIEKQFSRLDEAVANLKRVKANLRRYRVSTLVAAMGDWPLVSVGSLCDCIVPNRDKPRGFTGSTPWLTLPDFDEDEIAVGQSRQGLGLSDEEIAASHAKVVPAGSVLMSCVGRFGVTAVLRRSAVINQQLHAFLPSDRFIPAFLAYALRTRVAEMQRKATATTIAYLNKSNCNSISVPLPPLDEQLRIVADGDRRLSIVREVETEVDANLKRAEVLRQATLTRSFSMRARDGLPN